MVQPLATMAIFTLIFGRLAKMPSDGLPYSVFAFTGLLPWNYFSQALTRSSTSLVGNAGLISKVYFPRLIVPLSAVIAPLVDFAVAFLALVCLMIWFSIAPTWHWLLLPLFLSFAAMSALAVGLWLAALNVRYRDVGHTIPFPDSVLDVCFTGCLSCQSGAGTMAITVQSQSYGRCNRRVSLVPSRQRDARSLGSCRKCDHGLSVAVGWGLFFKRMEKTFADVV